MILFLIAEPFSKSKHTSIWREERSPLWAVNEFFKSNMDALTVLSILGHWYLFRIFQARIVGGFVENKTHFAFSASYDLRYTRYVL